MIHFSHKLFQGTNMLLNIGLCTAQSSWMLNISSFTALASRSRQPYVMYHLLKALLLFMGTSND